MHEIHILKLVGAFILGETALYLIVNLWLMVKWTRYYSSVKTAANVVFFGGEVRWFEFVPLFLIGNFLWLLGVFFWGASFLIGLLGIRVSL